MFSNIFKMLILLILNSAAQSQTNLLSNTSNQSIIGHTSNISSFLINDLSSLKRDEMINNEQIFMPKFSQHMPSYGPTVLSLKTPNNLAPLMNRWIRPQSTSGRGLQSLFRSFPRVSSTNGPFRSPFKPVHLPMLSSHEHSEMYQPAESGDVQNLANAAPFRLFAPPTESAEEFESSALPSLSQLFQRRRRPFFTSDPTLSFEYADRSPLSTYSNTKDSSHMEIHNQANAMDPSLIAGDSIFGSLYATDVSNSLSKPLRSKITSLMNSGNDINGIYGQNYDLDNSPINLDGKKLSPFVTYDQDEVRLLFPRRKNQHGNRKRKPGNLNGNTGGSTQDTNLYQGNSLQESNGVSSSSNDYNTSVLLIKDGINENNSFASSNVAVGNRKTATVSQGDNEALLKLLDKKLSSADLLNLIVQKLSNGDRSLFSVPNGPTITARPQYFLDDLVSHPPQSTDSRKIALRNTIERSVGDPDAFNFEKDYSYFETPKCALGLNSTFCLQDDHYPGELIREDIQLNRNQIRSMFGVWLHRQENAEAQHHHLVDYLNDREDENYNWNHYFVVDQRSDRLKPDLATTSSDNPEPTYGNSWSEAERGRIRLRNDYYRRGGYICSSAIIYSNLKRAKNLDKQWKFIINFDEKLLGQNFRQTVRLEQCIYPDVSCNYLSSAFNSHCVQKYNYQQLVSWTKELGVHLDVYRLPIACSCHFRRTLSTKQ